MQKYLWFFFIGFSLATNSYGQNQLNSIETANSAIEKKDYTSAISVLEKHLKEAPEQFDAIYLLAKTHAWNKDINQGLALLDSLLERFPTNSDYLLSKATFLSWQDKNAQAIDLLHSARLISPNYQDVWKLEIKLRHRVMKGDNDKSLDSLILEYENRFNDFEYTRQFKPSNLAKQMKYKNKKSIGLGFGHDELTGNQPDWNDFSISFSNNKEKYVYSAQLEFLNHFNIKDQQFSFQYLYKNYFDYQIQALASFSTENTLVPNWSLGSQVNHALGKNGNAELFYKHNTYANMYSDIFRVAYAHNYRKFELKAHMLFTFIDSTHYVETPGYIFQISYFHNDKVFIRFSHSRNEELEFVVDKLANYDVSTYSIDGRYPVNEKIDLTLAFIHHIQDRVYKKNGIHTGLRYIY